MAESSTIVLSRAQKRYLGGWACGAVVFPTALAINQTVLKQLRIGAHIPVVSTSCGFISAVSAGMVASAAYVVAHDAIDVLHEPTWRENLRIPRMRVGLTDSAAVEYAVHGLTAAGVVWILGGRFKSLCPSSIMHVGAYGDVRHSLPARRFIKATSSQRTKISQIGSRIGCHTCGKRGFRARYISDHQPPSKFAHSGQQRFYPHCSACSNKQGGLSAQSASKTVPPIHLIHHGLSLRGYHTWLPLSVVVLLLLSDQQAPYKKKG